MTRYKVEPRHTPDGWKDDWQVTDRSTGEMVSAWPRREDARTEASELNATYLRAVQEARQ